MSYRYVRDPGALMFLTNEELDKSIKSLEKALAEEIAEGRDDTYLGWIPYWKKELKKVQEEKRQRVVPEFMAYVILDFKKILLTKIFDSPWDKALAEDLIKDLKDRRGKPYRITCVQAGINNRGILTIIHVSKEPKTKESK